MTCNKVYWVARGIDRKDQMERTFPDTKKYFIF